MTTEEMTEPPPLPVCESLAGPHADGPLRPYVKGWRCPAHTPAAEAGRPEAPPGPGWPARRPPPTPPTPPWPPVAPPGGTQPTPTPPTPDGSSAQ